jgi:Protein of unknown function (DUF732)
VIGLAMVGAAIWGGVYLWTHHTVEHVAHSIGTWLNEDETGFVQAMRNAGYHDDANVALDAGHRICGKLRKDGATPTEVVNTLTADPGGIDPALLRRMSFEFVTNAQVYLCPDTLHNTGTTPVPAPTATRAPTVPPTMVTAPGEAGQGCVEYTMPDDTCRNCPPSWGADCQGGPNVPPQSIPDNWEFYCRVQSNAPAYCPQPGTNQWCLVWPTATGCSLDQRWTGEPPTPTTIPTTGEAA